MYFAQNLDYLMRIRRITGRSLAKQLEKEESTISQYKKGKNSPPVDILIKISEILDVDIDSLLKIDLESNQIYPKGSSVYEPEKNYGMDLAAENKRLKSRIDKLELALYRHIKDRDILKRYLDDA